MFMSNMKLKMGGMAAVVTAIVVAGVILINMLAGMLTDRFFLKMDLTATRLFDISGESAMILRDLPEQATIYMLMNELGAANELSSSTGLDLVSLLEKYVSLSNGKITLRYLDPTLNPNIREQFGLASVARGDIVIEGPNRVKYVSIVDTLDLTDGNAIQGYRAEQALTGALLHVMAETVPGVVFAEGHGMLPADAISSGVSLGMLREMFEQSGFSSSTLNLAMNEIPEGTHVVVLACPMTDFTHEEITKLDEFIKSGGNVLYLSERERNANLSGWLLEWGIQMEDFFVMDEVERISNPLFVIPLINAHDMFNSVGVHSLPLVQIPRALRLAYTERGSVTVQGVLGTSQHSYGRLIDSENSAIDRAEDDAAGPFIIGAVSTYRTYDSRTAQATDSHLIVLPYSLSFDFILSYYAYLNNDMTGALVRYLTPTDMTSGLVIPTKALYNPILTLSGIPSLMTSIFLVGVLPLGIFVAGLMFWRRRRKR
jgi:hypothetical protein